MNKVVSHVWEIVSKAREEWESEAGARAGAAQTSSVADTNALVAAVSMGKNLKPPPPPQGMMGGPPPGGQRGPGSLGPPQGPPQGGMPSQSKNPYNYNLSLCQQIFYYTKGLYESQEYCNIPLFNFVTLH